MKKLYVLFDSRCRLCTRCACWLRFQPAYLAIETVPASSHRISVLFPGLRASPEPEELVVVADTGEVYRGLSAWLMCLYALRRYRSWSLRLARPAWRPFARGAVSFLSEYRDSLSSFLGARSFEEMLQEVAPVPAPGGSCGGGAGSCEAAGHRPSSAPPAPTPRP